MLDYEHLHQNDKIVGIDALNLGKNTFCDWTSYPSLITRLDNFRDDLEENHSTMPVILIGGFLAKEQKYQHLRKLITQKPHIFIPEAIQPNILHYISSRNPYVDIHLCLSNVPNTGMPLLDRIEYLDNFDSTVNVIPWVDNRGKVKIYQSDSGVHLDAFLSVNKHMQGDTIEVVNVEKWTDSGSSLLNTEMIMLDEFMERPPESDTVFFHILVGHGMGIDKYINLVKKCITNYERVVILEHNSKSEDFSREIGTTPKRLEEALGRPVAKEFTSGKKSSDRNFVLVY